MFSFFTKSFVISWNEGQWATTSYPFFESIFILPSIYIRVECTFHVICFLCIPLKFTLFIQRNYSKGSIGFTKLLKGSVAGKKNGYEPRSWLEFCLFLPAHWRFSSTALCASFVVEKSGSQIVCLFSLVALTHLVFGVLQCPQNVISVHLFIILWLVLPVLGKWSCSSDLQKLAFFSSNISSLLSSLFPPFWNFY